MEWNPKESYQIDLDIKEEGLWYLKKGMKSIYRKGNFLIPKA